MRDAPTYAQPLQRGVVGDDPLGLAPTNERLYNSALPGFNNYVQHIRVYSSICWMAEQVESALERGAAQTNRQASELYAGAMEKLELALVWANPGVPGLAGTQRVFPAHDEQVEFRFGTFGTSQATLFDAPTYKPSLTNGLHFMVARAGDTYGCLDYGQALAAAFDQGVQPFADYAWFRAPDQLLGQRSQVQALAPALDVRTPSAAEQHAFLQSFFPAALDTLAPNDQRSRWLTLTLMLRAVDAVSRANDQQGREAAASVVQVRACMARGVSEVGEWVVEEHTARVQAWWAVLQVRQLQRYCLEAVYCAVERWIAHREADNTGHSLDDCVSELAAAGLAAMEVDAASVAQLVESLAEAQGDHLTLYEAAASRPPQHVRPPEVDVFRLMDAFRHRTALDVDEEGHCAAVGSACVAVVFCAVEAGNLMANPHAAQAMAADGDACSLARLAEAVHRYQHADLATFVAHIIKDWVVLRHFAVVGSRSAALDGKNRFRIVLGDYGLERFDKSARLPEPGMSQDKLRHAMMLCEQSGLLARTNGSYRLTAAGLARLA